jgi:hypothetical protein
MIKFPLWRDHMKKLEQNLAQLRVRREQLTAKRVKDAAASALGRLKSGEPDRWLGFVGQGTNRNIFKAQALLQCSERKLCGRQPKKQRNQQKAHERGRKASQERHRQASVALSKRGPVSSLRRWRRRDRPSTKALAEPLSPFQAHIILSAFVIWRQFLSLSMWLAIEAKRSII